MLAEAGDVTRSPARRLIVAYAAAAALLNLSVVLPDNPYSFSSTKGAIAAVAIQALIVWGLWRGSVVAWVVATALAVVGFLTIPLMAPPAHISVLLMWALSFVQAAILCTRGVRAFVDRGGRDLSVQHFP